MVVPFALTTAWSSNMIEFFLTARSFYLRVQVAPETLLGILIIVRLWQRLA